MKQKMSLVLFFSFFIFYPLVKVHSFDLKLSPIIEYRNTGIGEYVVQPNYFKETNKPWVLSELQWQADIILDLGLKAEIVFQNLSFFTKATIAVPLKKIGFMLDEDYLFYDGKFIYSCSDIGLDFFYDTLLGFTWTPFLYENKKNLSIGTSIEWRSMQVTSYDGTQFVYLHDEFFGYATKFFLPGKGISYKQNVLLWWIDASFYQPLYKNIFSNFTFSYSPFWYGEAYDRHHLRNENGSSGLDFLDIVKASSAYKIEADFLCGIKRNELGLSLSYSFIPMKTGMSGSKSAEEENYVVFKDSLGGISLSEFSASIFYRFHFTF